MWCALRKSGIIGPFFLNEATINIEFYPALLQGFLIPELRQLNLLRMNLLSAGARGGAVVEALRYKPEGRGIDSRWCHWL
jgi:hypothetical protein